MLQASSKTVLGFSLLAICFVLGCAESKSPTGSVAGKITAKGQVFSDCRVSIYCPQSSLNLGSRVNAEGVFEIKDVPPGDYVVVVFPIPKEQKEGFGPDPPDTSPIPKQFRTREKTNISLKIEANEVSELSIELFE